MKASAPVILVAALWLGGAACQQQPGPLDALHAMSPQVQWDTVVVRADVDGDGREDSAYLGRAGGRIYVGVVLAESEIVDVLDFAISGGIQEAICSEPATLGVEDTDYPLSEIGPLQGFRPGTGARGLRLTGGECDSIHLFWDHDHARLGWWRL
ncbi:MAG: hypothetical protein U0974_14690 [Gemmatimonadales bacterium]|nr:hypothetical protein [Gemmatimonadales bacterium]MDZ4390965.1 hypothetical protein [Gemmatimonadales bacterium]